MEKSFNTLTSKIMYQTLQYAIWKNFFQNLSSCFCFKSRRGLRKYQSILLASEAFAFIKVWSVSIRWRNFFQSSASGFLLKRVDSIK